MQTPTEVGVKDDGGDRNRLVYTKFLITDGAGMDIEVWFNDRNDRPAYAAEMVPLSQMRAPGGFFRQMVKARLS